MPGKFNHADRDEPGLRGSLGGFRPHNNVVIVLLGRILQLAGAVDAVAHCGVGATKTRAEIAHEGRARFDPDANPRHGFALLATPEVPLPYPLDHLHGRLNSQVCMIVHGHRSPPERNQAIACVFVEGALMMQQRIGKAMKEFTGELCGIFQAALGREPRIVLHVR